MYLFYLKQMETRDSFFFCCTKLKAELPSYFLKFTETVNILLFLSHSLHFYCLPVVITIADVMPDWSDLL